MKRKRINLALQGGGAHDIYTWGVLDRIREACGGGACLILQRYADDRSATHLYYGLPPLRMR
jgi:hypothetical protein